MSFLRPLTVLVLAAASLAAAPVTAGSRQGGVGLPLDPELLPANSGPGDCVVRRVTGPGGAYRWDRVECDPDHGWSSYDQWGYGRGRLDVETRRDEGLLGGPPRYNFDAGDRYGERRQHDGRYEQRVEEYEHERVRAYGDGYDQGRGGPVDSYASSYAYGYVAAGRDEAGYLIWPGKRP
jgi:hypothetical protein